MSGNRVLVAVLTSCATVAMYAGPSAGPASAVSAPGTSWDTQAQFTTGTTLNNTVATAVDDGEVRLSDETTAFPFIWVALSNRGTIAKIDTLTGNVLGEYRSAPQTVGYPNPSRTTVAKDGSVWSGNRSIAAVVHVGVSETEQCVDRNGNGAIDTSHAYGDVKDWPVDGVANAADECILNYVPTYGDDARHVSVDASGDIWVGNFYGWPHRFNRIDSSTGTIVQTEDMMCGGYGGLVDRSGVIWSSTAGTGQLLRWDPTTAPTEARCITVPVYGVAEDSQGNIWVSNYENDNSVRRISPDGNTIDVFPMQRGLHAQGLAISQDSAGTDHIWVSSAMNGGPNMIAHLLGDGTWVGNVTGMGVGSTGVAVDPAGKIWTANYDSSDATRIDPNSGPTGAGGNKVGAFELSVPLPATSGLPPANPYNYSDMTGSSLKGAPDSGTWTGLYDSGAVGADWGKVSWNATVPLGASMSVRVAASNDRASLGAGTLVTNGTPFTETGRYVMVTVVMNRAPGGAASGSPVLSDLTLLPKNTAPAVVADTANVAVSEGSAASNTGTFSDADGDTVTLSASVGTVTASGPGTWTWAHTPADGPADSQTVTITANDGTDSSTANFDLQVSNLAPTITSVTPSVSTVLTGQPVTFVGQATDPSGPDTTAGFSWSFNRGAYGSSNSVTTQYATCGTTDVTALAKDKDGGVSRPFTSSAVVAIDSGFRPPLRPGLFNKVQRGQVVPVKINAGCDGVTATGLQPTVQLLAGDVDPSTDPGDGSVDVTTESVSSADTTGIMRAADGQYIYNLRVPSSAPGTKYTIRVRPSGSAAGGALYVVIQLR